MQNNFSKKNLASGFLDNAVEYLKGVGPKKAEILQSELGIFKYRDLLSYFPFRFIDKSMVSRVVDLFPESGNVQLRGLLSNIQVQGQQKSKRLTAILRDESGFIELIWFKNYQYIHKVLKENERYTVYGKVNSFNGKLSISHPEIKLYSKEDDVKEKPMEPIYPLTEKLKSVFMDSKFFMQSVEQILHHPEFELPEHIPDSVTKPLKLLERKWAYYFMHLPKDELSRAEAERRIKFEEMFSLAMRSEKSKVIRHLDANGIPMNKSGHLVNEFYHNHLGFELTDAQKRVIKEIRKDMAANSRMNRLLQGDVGSGKTIVALFCMLVCVDNGYQACLMAPTEILATQHFLTLKDQLKEMSVNVDLLTGSSSKKHRQQLLEKLQSGELQILVGTHALIEDVVEFKQLGLAVIDEQHRFGVAQRAKLWNKAGKKPHVLVMTATPIPRTLAMTIHGELDVSVIDELPKDRKPIRTIHREEKFRGEVMNFLKTELMKGRQAYIVYPLIEESSKLDLNDLMTGYDVVCSYFPVPQYQISLMHGKMKPDVKDFEMKRFKDGITQIMIATTVIEVGVNVPNASVMIIENANRFGLSQLHQLRGRVGRGAEQSFCVLMTKDELNFPAKKRIKTMCATNNGFDIAKVDLELRGPGDMLGTRQSGLPDFKLLDLVKDDDIIDLAKRASAFVLKDDPNLTKPENRALLQYLMANQDDYFWGRVS